MKKLYKYLFLGLAAVSACNPLDLDDIQDPNNPSVGSVASNASRGTIQQLVTGLESRHRDYVSTMSRAWCTFGREVWYFGASDPRFQTDWLGINGRTPDANYFGFGANGGSTYAGAYQAIKQASTLINAAQNTNILTNEEKFAISGFSKTIMGYQFLIPANLVYDNGIRIDVDDPLNPGPYVPYQDALTHAVNLLDQGLADLNNAGSGNFPFLLSDGWSGFNSIDQLKRVNRAIAARANIYRGQWQNTLDALSGSFINASGSLTAGPAHSYGAPPDAFNPMFFVLDADLSAIVVVHPSMFADATPGDKRVTDKFFQRTTPVTISTGEGLLTGTHQDKRWASNTSSVPFIKNEELILLRAEALVQRNQGNDLNDAVADINIIRNAAEIGDYSGVVTQAGLINEILYQRRYSLWGEPWGHRWIDTRRYDRMSEIPVGLDGGTVFRQFPHPQADLNWDTYVGN